MGFEIDISIRLCFGLRRKNMNEALSSTGGIQTYIEPSFPFLFAVDAVN